MASGEATGGLIPAQTDPFELEEAQNLSVEMETPATRVALALELIRLRSFAAFCRRNRRSLPPRVDRVLHLKTGR